MGTLWDTFYTSQAAHRERVKNGAKVLNLRNIPQEKNDMGLMQWYMHPELKDRSINTLIVAMQEIKPGSRSGKLKRAGGQLVYIWHGAKGHTDLNGKRYDWSKGDIVQLPLLTDGNVVQHFNDDSAASAYLLCVEVNTLDLLGVDRGPGFEMLEKAPD